MHPIIAEQLPQIFFFLLSKYYILFQKTQLKEQNNSRVTRPKTKSNDRREKDKTSIGLLYLFFLFGRECQTKNRVLDVKNAYKIKNINLISDFKNMIKLVRIRTT